MRNQTKRVLTLLLALALCLGLLPAAAMAEETEGEYDITFDANGGQFSDGNTTVVMRTQSSSVYGSDEVHHYVAHPNEDPTRAGYRFVCWYLVSPTENPGITGINFTKNETVRAYWEPLPEVVLTLDPNGGTCPVKTVKLDTSGTAPTLREELPVPTREGYDFVGWYYKSYGAASHEVKVGDTFGSDATLTAEWQISQAPPETVRVDFDPNGGRISHWYGRDIPVLNPGDSMGPVANNGRQDVYIDPNSGIGIDETDKSLRLSGFPTAVRDGYTFDGWYTMKTGGNKITESFVFPLNPTHSYICMLYAHWTKGSANPNGPFTVKFDLNYKTPSESEIPKEQKIAKGGAVDLPDGRKLTSPYTSHEFYAWCMKGDDGKLYPWKDGTPVTADMTLYAGWIRKGTVVKDGEAVPEASNQPAAPKFTDVAASSPFAAAISWAVEQGITNGTTPTTFSPGNPCTRAQIVTFLWRAAGSPEPKATEAEYADVTNTTAYFYKAIQWAAEMGMEESGTFKPGDPCTRGQAMYFIWKARGAASSAGSAPSFTDLSKDSLYYDAVLWAVGQGVTNGTTPTTFSPDSPCTRGQIVTFLYRAYAK